MRELLSGLLGVVVGATLSWLRELWSENRHRTRHARYVAIRVVCALDRYVDRCADVASDDGLCQGQPNAEGCLEAQVDPPPPPAFSEDLDWKSIEPALMYRILSLPSEAESAKRLIDAVADFTGPPDYEPFFEERQDQYAKLGLAAYSLTEEIRKKYGIPAQERGEWDPAAHLAKVREQVAEERRQRRDRVAQLPSVI
jgi:hypothetical protein